VTNTPGLAGSLLVGICFAKGLAFVENKPIIGVNHLEGHVFSPFLTETGGYNTSITFPHMCLSVSGGHTALYYVQDFGVYSLITQTIDDAAGEAFDKIAKVLDLGYPGGPQIEKCAHQAGYIDFFRYPRTKMSKDKQFFSFSGLKTAVLYDLVKRGAYDLKTGPRRQAITPELQQQVASSLLVCVGDVFESAVRYAFKNYKSCSLLTFTGGVACNKYLRARLAQTCEHMNKKFIVTPPQFCTDNGAMIAFVGSYKCAQNKFSDLSLDVVL
jgi:N6-L-threonylcarbamoyladenine synthase